MEQAFGKYSLIERIAVGGMGEVFLAKLRGPVGFKKLLVIKRLRFTDKNKESLRDMFLSEARIEATLSHQNIVQIFEMGQIDGAYFITMEYVHGQTLRSIERNARATHRPLHAAHIIELMVGVCDGLGHAHNAAGYGGETLHVIHRDINPSNLIVPYTGGVKIIDFGVAKSDLQVHDTATGTIKGKFAYMSPEQSRGDPLDKRSDIFSLGSCLYEALAERHPFATGEIVGTLDAIREQEPPPLRPEVSVFGPVVRTALAKRAEDRYQDCAEMRADLVRLLRDGVVAHAPETLAQYMRATFQDEIDRRAGLIDTLATATVDEVAARLTAPSANSDVMPTAITGRDASRWPLRRGLLLAALLLALAAASGAVAFSLAP